MPLMHGKSKKAFKHNVEVEMEKHPGKEHRAQNLAIAYSIKRKAAQKHAMGGHVKPHETLMEHEAKETEAHERKEHYMAKGGMLTHKGYQPKADHHYDADFADLEHYKEEKASGYVPHESAAPKHNMAAEHEDKKMLNQHGAHEKGPEGRHYAKGGLYENIHAKQERIKHGSHEKMRKPGAEGAPTAEAFEQAKKTAKMAYGGYAHGGEAHPHQSEKHEMDMVGKIMKQRQHMYSHGGQVANDDHPFEYEFEEPNQFDDLVKRDDLNFHYTGENSGDYLSNAREDHDRKDIVSKIMKSRAKKDKYPKGYPGL